jgi:hypothetical protein
MAQHDQLALIAKGAKIWNEWRARYHITPDLSEAKLSRANLRGFNLQGAKMIRADLGLADLRRANLNLADMTRCNLIGATMSGADMRGTVLIGCNNMVVIETPDALLVCPKEKAQDIKEVVDNLPEQLR